MDSRKEKRQPLYSFGRFILKIAFFVLYRYRVEGLENIPESGSLLLCCNHTGYKDPIILGIMQKRQVFYMAKEELFKNKFIGFILRHLGAFPVLRGTGGEDALKEADVLLEKGREVGVFIEGTRSKTGELLKPKTGAALLAWKSAATVVPVCITPEKGACVTLFGRASVKIGAPIPFEKLKMADDSGMELRKASRVIMAEIAALRAKALEELGRTSGVGKGDAQA